MLIKCHFKTNKIKINNQSSIDVKLTVMLLYCLIIITYSVMGLGIWGWMGCGIFHPITLYNSIKCCHCGDYIFSFENWFMWSESKKKKDILNWSCLKESSTGYNRRKHSFVRVLGGEIFLSLVASIWKDFPKDVLEE